MRKKKKQLTERKSFSDGTLAWQFTYSVKVPCPLEGKSLFETHCSQSLLRQQHTDRLCVCVCAPTHTWLLPTQNAANHVCTSWRERKKEGGKERRKFDKVLDREKEEEAGRCLYSQLLPWKHTRQYRQPLPQGHEGFLSEISPPSYFSFPLQEDSLAMSKLLRPPPPLLFPATQSPVASKRRGEVPGAFKLKPDECCFNQKE